MIDLQKIQAGERRQLAKAITLIESTREEDQESSVKLLEEILLLRKRNTFRIGITGSPGVGKSTFIETFGLYLTSLNYKVAILAIDPSSPTSGGSILGDKTRMEKLSIEPNAFIRPSPSAGYLGGVAQKTRETILLCEAAQFDFILVETVGVGQSEFDVADMVDFFMLLILPTGGDELQGIKKGILELADLILINKADGEHLAAAKKTQAQYSSATQITKSNTTWTNHVLLNSSLDDSNSKEIFNILNQYQKIHTENKLWETKRSRQNINWFHKLTNELLLKTISKNESKKKQLELLTKQVESQQITPLAAAQKVLDFVVK